MSLARLKYVAARAGEVMRETGPAGFVRRAARAGLDGAADGLLDVGRHLDRVALAMTLDEAARRAVARTQADEGRERGRRTYVLGPNAAREVDWLRALVDPVLVASWTDAPLPGVAPAAYLVGHEAPRDRAELLAKMEAVPTATFLLPLGAFPLDEAPPRLRFMFPTVHPSRLRGTTLHAKRFPACADDLQLALTYAILLGGSPVHVVGAAYEDLRTPAGGNLPDPGPLPEARPAVLGKPAPTRYAEAVRRSNRLYEGYRYLAEEAKRRGQVLVTVGPTSFFDVFPRIAADAAHP